MPVTTEQVERLQYVEAQLQPLRSAFNALAGFVADSLAAGRLLNEQAIDVDGAVIESQFTLRYMGLIAELDAANQQVWRYVPPEGP